MTEKRRRRAPEDRDSDSSAGDDLDRIPEEDLEAGAVGLDTSEDLEMDEDSEAEDLFGRNYMKDYESKGALDYYEVEEEDENVQPLTRRQREAAERELSMFDPDTEIASELGYEDVGPEEQGASPEPCPIDNFDTLQSNLEHPEFRDRIKAEVVRFLRVFEGRKYLAAIRHMCSLNTQSLYVDHFDLHQHNQTIALAALSLPLKLLPILNEALSVAVLGMFPKYLQIRPFLSLRLTNIPSRDQIRDLRNVHLNTLVSVCGIITRRSAVYPLLSLVKYNCLKCNGVIGPFLIESDLVKPNKCLECQGTGPFTVNSAETIYKDFQKVTLQETPGTIPAGRLPRNKEVILLFDLIDHVRPGDEIEVVGVYRNNFSNSLNIRNGFPVFFTSIEALSIAKRSDSSSFFSIGAEDEEEIRAISRRKDVMGLVIRSIAPSIHGHYEVKRALAISMFGGVQKNSDGRHRVRGDINVLLLGDPGMAKTQFLKYIEKTAHRAVFATGQGASAVGLTAMVRKDPVTREWTLEGGALVLADRGVCLIDEFDKMRDTDRVSIHEAMEQQSISISKAGIVTSLQARCAVIAAANPVRGRYNSSLSFAQNANLTDPIVSRFDIVCVIKDEGEPEFDEKLARFIVESHCRSVDQGPEAGGEEEGAGDAISQEMLRKYVVFARERVTPVVEDFDIEKISSLYVSLRKESASVGGIPITVRHVESIVRISEATARLHLRGRVQRSDIDTAISVVLDSFCGTQKASVKRALRKSFDRFVPRTGEKNDLRMQILREMVARTERHLRQTRSGEGARVSVEDFKKKAKGMGVESVGSFLSGQALAAGGFSLSPCGGFILPSRPR